MKLSEDDQAIMYRALTCLARETANNDFCGEVKTLRGRLADEGKEEGKKKPPLLFDEHDNWTEHGNALAHSVDKALKDIVNECRDDGVDLRHAAFIVQQQVSTAFLQAHVERWLAESKKEKAAKRA